jgi:N-acetylglutamate synthase/N-acetylornithine aminotransferase
VSSKNKWKIVAIAKGAGMIEPNMAVIKYIILYSKFSK